VTKKIPKFFALDHGVPMLGELFHDNVIVNDIALLLYGASREAEDDVDSVSRWICPALVFVCTLLLLEHLNNRVIDLATSSISDLE